MGLTRSHMISSLRDFLLPSPIVCFQYAFSLFLILPYFACFLYQPSFFFTLFPHLFLLCFPIPFPCFHHLHLFPNYLALTLFWYTRNKRIITASWLKCRLSIHWFFWTAYHRDSRSNQPKQQLPTYILLQFPWNEGPPMI